MGSSSSRHFGRCVCVRPNDQQSCERKEKNREGKTEIRRRNGGAVFIRKGGRIKRRRSSFNKSQVIQNPAFQGSNEAGSVDSASVLDSEHDEFYSVHEAFGSEWAAVYADSMSIGAGDEESHPAGGAMNDNICGSLPNVCLPCLACAQGNSSASVEKKRSSNPSTPNSMKKPTSWFSFKWKDDSNFVPSPPRSFTRRPIAGSTVPFWPQEKTQSMTNCWSLLDPSSFKVRGQNYFKDKKKENAPNFSAFYPFGVDIFLSPRKINHIAQFVELPSVTASDECPSILVVNIQVPLYPPAIFQGENDGEGVSLVIYFKISQSYSKELPNHFRENITRFLNDEVERVKSFPVDTIAPFRERLKMLARLQNADNLQLSATEKKLLSTYNEKPVLTRPQHEFYLGENYLEIDLDMHRFSYVSRKGMQAIQERMKLCVLDFGLTIQGNKAEELPEHILGCLRFHEIDYANYSPLQ